MPMISAAVDIDEFLDEVAILRTDLPSDVRAKLLGRSSVTMDVMVRQDEIDENASEQEPEFFGPDAWQIRDAVAALFEGDLIMARTLFGRALAGDDAAAAAVEDEICKAIAARRSPQLAVAA